MGGRVPYKFVVGKIRQGGVNVVIRDDKVAIWEKRVDGERCRVMEEEVKWSGNSKLGKKVDRGCPQGSVLGPQIWKGVVDTITRDMALTGYEIIAYVDDCLIVICGKLKWELEKKGAVVVGRGKATFEAMKTTYGDNRCFFLSINSQTPNSTNAVQLPDPWAQFISSHIQATEKTKDEEMSQGIETAQEAGEKAAGISTPSILHPLSPVAADCSFTPNGYSLKLPGLGLLRRRVEEGPDLPAIPEVAVHVTPVSRPESERRSAERRELLWERGTLNDKARQLDIEIVPGTNVHTSCHRYGRTRTWTVTIGQQATNSDVQTALDTILEVGRTYHVYCSTDAGRQLMTILYNSGIIARGSTLKGVTYRLTKVENPTEQDQLIKDYHVGKTNHRGIRETVAHLRRRYYWRGMEKTSSAVGPVCGVRQGQVLCAYPGRTAADGDADPEKTSGGCGGCCGIP
ncbi:hypothetical protein AAG570_012717 [Ranatra chinensis]|uniref:Reverse transcriptase domain-containing protein n=1 Tax=Ranatra chinensis TaxID=642074 RepID=A0ABD0Z0W7_9HEMI